jgi:hypothetical protein
VADFREGSDSDDARAGEADENHERDLKTKPSYAKGEESKDCAKRKKSFHELISFRAFSALSDRDHPRSFSPIRIKILCPTSPVTAETSGGIESQERVHGHS